MPTRKLDVLQGTLDFLILGALSTGTMHGYEVARFIRERSAGALSVIDGALYTSLHRMEARGWVHAKWGLAESGKQAKFYTITREGRRKLASQTSAWERYTKAVRAVLDPPRVANPHRSSLQ